MKRLLSIVLTLVLGLALFIPAMAQDYPEQPQWPTLTVGALFGFSITIGDGAPQAVENTIVLPVEPGTIIILVANEPTEADMYFFGWACPWGETVFSDEPMFTFAMPDEDFAVVDMLGWISGPHPYPSNLWARLYNWFVGTVLPWAFSVFHSASTSFVGRLLMLPVLGIIYIALIPFLVFEYLFRW